MDEEPELYQCETCEVARQLDSLDPENTHAWALFQQAVTRFTVETHTVQMALEAACADDDPAEVFDVMCRLSVIYQALYPREKLRGA